MIEHGVRTLLLAWILCRATSAPAEAVADSVTVTVSPPVTVVERAGITGAGWATVVDAEGDRNVTLLYPNHTDDFGATFGSGMSRSRDGGVTWTREGDDQPIRRTVDLWLDRLKDGTLVAIGIRGLPDPKLRAYADPNGPPRDAYSLGTSRDGGRTWTIIDTPLKCPPELGVIARPLPHIIEADGGVWLLPAYAWSKAGHRSLLLESPDRGGSWNVRSTIATAATIREAGIAVTTPWLETAVARTTDGSLRTVIRTGSGEDAVLATTRSADAGRSWSPVERMSAGPERRPVAGKLPNLLPLPNGVLVLLTAHTKTGCRLYVSPDGAGKSWSDAHVVTALSGGNTSMVILDAETLLVFTPSSKRISCRRVTIRRL